MHAGPPSVCAAALAAALATSCTDAATARPPIRDPVDAQPGPAADAGADAGGAVMVSMSPTPAFDLVQMDATYRATSRSDPRFAVEIDCDDPARDQHYFGITPIIEGRRYEVFMWEGTFALLTPDFDAGAIRCVRVAADDQALSVRFEAGSYRALDPAAADTPVPLEARFSIENGRLVAQLAGIYYILPTATNTTVRLTVGGTLQTRTINGASPAFAEFFDGVTRVEVQDSLLGGFSFDTSIARLQLQRYLDGSQGFELDLDHAFKDLGQLSVGSKIVF